jgi:hypothetical protein
MWHDRGVRKRIVYLPQPCELSLSHSRGAVLFQIFLSGIALCVGTVAFPTPLL